MKIAHSLSEVPTGRSSVITIGNFDGLHLGHRSILERVCSRARELQVTSTAITFDPHPLQFIMPDRAPPLISTLDQKIQLLADIGIDLVLVQKFNDYFSKLSPKEFIYSYLIDHFRAQAVCLGPNFRFGHQHAGDLETLLEWRNHYEVIEVEPVLVGRDSVSSSAIRTALSEGDVRTARRMLGRCYEIEGTIVRGSGRGRSETVPTLNLEPQNQLLARNGVYVTRIAVEGGAFLQSVTNVGIRPTFDDSGQTIETYVLDGIVSVPGQNSRLKFLKRLRDEKEFSSPKDLLDQIRLDINTARKFFHRLDHDQAGIVENGITSLSARKNVC